MYLETLITGLLALGDDQLTATSRVNYVRRILRPWEWQEYLANRENGMCHEAAYADILKGPR